MSQPFDAASSPDAVRAVSAAVAASDFAGAARLAEEALARGIVHPALFNARALWFERQGRDDDALSAFTQARALTPRDARLLNAIALCLTRLHRWDEAIETFDDAIGIEPTYPASHHRRGLALGLAGRLDASEQAHRRAALLSPRYVEALASVAAIAARKGNARAARDYAARALKLEPDEPTAHAALAALDNADGAFAAAEGRLAPLLNSEQLAGHGRAVIFGLLGDALDGQDRAEEAFAAYKAANEIQRQLHAARFRGVTRATRDIENLTSAFAATPDEDWILSDQSGAEAPGPKSHVFLLGFHRSGTTLLEQALESHPAVVTLDERDCLSELAGQFLSNPAALDRLAKLEGQALNEARTNYWRRVAAEGIACDGKVFVDKHPFNAVKLPLIQKLFPRAKVLFAIRDPRDVVLSCFRRQFDVDAVKLEFLSLDGTAELYDRVMRFSDLCRQKLRLDIFDHRYEDLIADFDGQTQKVCAFIGVPWSDSVRNFAVAAQDLDAHAQSAGQLRRGLFREGVGHWRRYAAQLAPVEPLLRHWIARFGYSRE